VQTWDGTVAAQKALSCIYRTDQRFGVTYLTDVLLGKANERMRRFGHHQVSTFGIGKELSADQWKSVYRQLVAAGLAQVDVEGHGGLRLTEQSRPVLRGEQPVRLRQDPDRKRRRGSERSSPVVAPADPEAHALWERLRARRRELAAEQNVPPYVVFGDVTLREMVTYRPRDASELACLTGVGAVKLERYAADFLRVLAEHQAEHGRPDKVPALPDKPLRTTSYESARGGRSSETGLSDTVLDTLALFREGRGVDAIASQRGIKSTTVWMHLSRCIEAGELGLGDVIQLHDDELKAIRFAFE
jgi:ATP-dependent DNA helicase RecQ